MKVTINNEMLFDYIFYLSRERFDYAIFEWECRILEKLINYKIYKKIKISPKFYKNLDF